MGGVTSAASNVLSTAGSVFGRQEGEADYYSQMASAAYRQALLTRQNAQRQGGYMFEASARQNNRLQQDYLQIQSAQKTAIAASGLGHSATAQSILRSSRVNALLEQESELYNLNTALYENNQTADQTAWNLLDQGNQYNHRAQQGPSWWSKLNQFNSLLSGRR